MKISICIPSYNRAKFLSPLLGSILSQIENDCEILICEDVSPEREDISRIVKTYQSQYPDIIRYEENENNLGYDGNIRRLIERAKGDYCLFMGNDDLMCPGAIKSILGVIEDTPDCGVIVRTYATFEDDPESLKQVFRYFPDRHVIAAGEAAISTAYRRSVVIPGMVIHRESALKVSTDKFDGTLLYQLYLVGMILAHKSVVFNPDIVALRRDGIPPDFGNSEKEKGKFVPHDQTPDSSVHFVKGMLAIADHIDSATGLRVSAAIRNDIGSYSYPIIAIQARRPTWVFLKYGLDLAKLGLWRYPLFYLYFTSLLLIGDQRSDKIIKWIKSRLGYTPRLGSAR